MPNPEEIRKNIRDLGEAIAQIRQWRAAQGETASVRPPGRTDDELLNACQKIVASANRVISGRHDNEAAGHLASLDFEGMKTSIHNARLHTAAAIIAQINRDANAVLKKAGTAALHECFSEYGEFFALLEDAVPMADRVQNQPEHRARFLDWTAQNLPKLISLHKRLVVSEGPAVKEKWRRIRNIVLTLLGLMTAVIGVIIAFASRFAN